MVSKDGSVTEPQIEEPPIAALARKRRMQLRNKAAAAAAAASKEDDDSVSSGEDSSNKRIRVEEVLSGDDGQPKPSLRGIKKQARYVPGVPMTKEELKAWRKEARRVRNRESAAASRKRNRERITELETEVSALQSKYTAALQRIVELEAATTLSSTFTPLTLRQDIANMVMSNKDVNPLMEERTIQTVSPPMSPRESFSLMQEEDLDQHINDNYNDYQHIMDPISRPIA